MDWNAVWTSGDFDYPPAISNTGPTPATSTTNHSPARELPDVTTRLHHLRNLLNSRRTRASEETRRALNLLEREELEGSAEPMSDRLHRRRRALESQISDYQFIAGDINLDPPSYSSAHSRPRPRRSPTRPSERWQRSRPRPSQSALYPRTGPERHESRHSAVPAELGGRPVPRIGSPDSVSQEYLGEARVNMDHRWRAKRRRIDSDEGLGGPKAMRYGHRGQVVSGPMKMEMVSCDTGRNVEAGRADSWPSNMLRDDQSVYCTNSGSCNILLRHHKGMPFSLRKVVIKAPEDGFEAPIQQGMVFVSLHDDRLLSRTARYQAHRNSRLSVPPALPPPPPVPPQTRARQHEYSRIRLQPSHEYFASSRSPLPPLDRSDYLQDPFPPLPSQRRGTSVPFDNGESSESDNDGTRRDESIRRSPSLVPGFHTSMQFEDFDSGEEDIPIVPPAAVASSGHERVLTDAGRLSHPRSWQDRASERDELVELSLGQRTADSEEHTSPDEFLLQSVDSDTDTPDRRRMWASQYRSRVSDYQYPQVRQRHSHVRPTRIDVVPDDDDDNNSNGKDGNDDSASSADGPRSSSQILAPHAQFCVRERKDCITIRFDPVVTGRFVLIKLWGPVLDCSMEIQSITVHGFAGPRYLPSRELQ